ncbi:MAG TPA: T9SS type A sorting domain-containing protein [Bacteroidales bacterium]|nr:T9SS type A sorting domain-containing protein [Bacteroidales bacterium]
MKKLFFLFAMLLSALVINAQYATPGNGMHFTIDDLVEYSSGAVTFDPNGQYSFHQDVTLSATDTLSIIFDAEINMADNVLVTVNGTMIVNPLSGIVLFKAQNDHFRGFRFDNSSGSSFYDTYFKKAGGIRLLSSDVAFTFCDFTEFDQQYTTGTINVSGSVPVITLCNFTYNDGPAVMSAANGNASPQIINCEIRYNVAANGNTPQINLGTSGADSIRIIGNTIEGNPDNFRAGGIAITTLAGGSVAARIEDNDIFNNRYGITVFGNNLGVLVRGNEIKDNNTQNLPMLGGSGININGNETNQAIITGNTITGNLWGISLQGTPAPNIGQLDSADYNPGENVIYGNGNEGEVYDLYNNTPNDIMAQNNHWGTTNIDSVESHIFHQPDDPTLGLVTYLPIAEPVGISEPATLRPAIITHIFPNPATRSFFVEIESSEISDSSVSELQLFDAAGRLIAINIDKQSHGFKVFLKETYQGIAFLKITFAEREITKKIIFR